jgi:hypothetical protein
LGYKTQFLEFVKVKRGFWVLEKKKQGLLFLVLELQNQFASTILLASRQSRFGKNYNPYDNMQIMTIVIEEMFAKKKGFEQDNKKIVLLLLYPELPKPSWCVLG